MPLGDCFYFGPLVVPSGWTIEAICCMTRGLGLSEWCLSLTQVSAQGHCRVMWFTHGSCLSNLGWFSVAVTCRIRTAGHLVWSNSRWTDLCLSDFELGSHCSAFDQSSHSLSWIGWSFPGRCSNQIQRPGFEGIELSLAACWWGCWLGPCSNCSFARSWHISTLIAFGLASADLNSGQSLTQRAWSSRRGPGKTGCARCRYIFKIKITLYCLGIEMITI